MFHIGDHIARADKEEAKGAVVGAAGQGAGIPAIFGKSPSSFFKKRQEIIKHLALGKGENEGGRFYG
jgi:hypothetical protein